jgi:hypothetical protein
MFRGNAGWKVCVVGVNDGRSQHLRQGLTAVGTRSSIITEHQEHHVLFAHHGEQATRRPRGGFSVASLVQLSIRTRVASIAVSMV